MTDLANHGTGTHADHLTWVRVRLMLDQELMEANRHGFSLIAAGFGSFSVFEGLALGERAISELPRTFALVVTAVGICAVVLAVTHNRKMSAWVDADEFGIGAAPRLPDERRPHVVAAVVILIGVVSFVALLLLP